MITVQQEAPRFKFERRALGLAVDHIRRVPGVPHTLEQVLWAAVAQQSKDHDIPRNPDFVLGDERTFTDSRTKDVFTFAEQKGLSLAKILSITLPRRGNPSIIDPSPIATVDFAYQNRFDGVAIQAHTISSHQEEEFDFLQTASRAASESGLHVVAVVYPRARRIDGTVETFTDYRDSTDPLEKLFYTRMVIEGMTKVAAIPEVKAVKVPLCADPERVIEAAKGKAVFLAGGERISEEKTVTDVYHAIRAGFNGAIVGRGIFEAEQPDRVIHALQGVIHEEMSPNRALFMAGIR